MTYPFLWMFDHLGGWAIGFITGILSPILKDKVADWVYKPKTEIAMLGAKWLSGPNVWDVSLSVRNDSPKSDLILIATLQNDDVAAFDDVAVDHKYQRVYHTPILVPARGLIEVSFKFGKTFENKPKMLVIRLANRMQVVIPIRMDKMMSCFFTPNPKVADLELITTFYASGPAHLKWHMSKKVRKKRNDESKAHMPNDRNGMA